MNKIIDVIGISDKQDYDNVLASLKRMPQYEAPLFSGPPFTVDYRINDDAVNLLPCIHLAAAYYITCYWDEHYEHKSNIWSYMRRYIEFLLTVEEKYKDSFATYIRACYITKHRCMRPAWDKVVEYVFREDHEYLVKQQKYLQKIASLYSETVNVPEKSSEKKFRYSTQEEILKYLYLSKTVKEEDVIKKIGQDALRNLRLANFISTQNGFCSLTKSGKEIYSIHKEPTLIQKIKGLYMHYVLRF